MSELATIGPMSCRSSSSSEEACISASISGKAFAKVSAAVFPTWRMPSANNTLANGRDLLFSMPSNRLEIERSPVRSRFTRSVALS